MDANIQQMCHNFISDNPNATESELTTYSFKNLVKWLKHLIWLSVIQGINPMQAFGLIWENDALLHPDMIFTQSQVQLPGVNTDCFWDWLLLLGAQERLPIFGIISKKLN